MAAAIWRIAANTGASPGTLGPAESGALVYGDDALITSTVAVAKPTAAGTAYSFTKSAQVEVTTAGAPTTAFSNRRIHHASAPSTGLTHFYRDDAATYVAPANAAADNATTNDATPTGFTVMPTTATAYDAASVNTALGRNGDYVSIAMGVSFLYAGGAGSAIALPSITITVDEA